MLLAPAWDRPPAFPDAPLLRTRRTQASQAVLILHWGLSGAPALLWVRLCHAARPVSCSR